MREIVLDTETTGLDPNSGHRIVEIGCVELHNHVTTGETFHSHINPNRDIPAEAEAVHGLSAEFLSNKPAFADIADDFLAFVGSSQFIAHNAPFDLEFINAELKSADKPVLASERAIDTVQIARRKFPGAQVNLDALCHRFNIDLSARIKHGALLDAELLAEVYLELIGGREPGLGLAASADQQTALPGQAAVTRQQREARPHRPNPEEQAAHTTFLEKITAPLWAN